MSTAAKIKYGTQQKMKPKTGEKKNMRIRLRSECLMPDIKAISTERKTASRPHTSIP